MMIQKTFGVSLRIMASVLLLSGCASTIFPDFADDTQVMINDGGKIEHRKIDGKGIIVADKENAVYEDEETQSNLFVQKKDAKETVVPAKTVNVDMKKLNPINKKAEVDNCDKKNISKVTEKTENKKVSIAKKIENKQENDDFYPTMHYLAETIYFDNGSGVVDYKFYDELKAIAKIAKDNNAIVSVYGYASSRTRNTDPVSHKLANFKVSAERAESVVRILRKQGVNKDKIVSQALSDSAPVYQEVMPEGERLNRRVEIYLTY